jgi:hypothetical protein
MALTNHKYYIGKKEEVYELAAQKALEMGCDGINTVYWGFIIDCEDGDSAWVLDLEDEVSVKTISKLPSKFDINA